MEKVVDDIKKLRDEDVWLLFGYLIEVLKERKLIRTKNIVGERGEFLAIENYNSISGLPKLQAAPEGTQNVDALSRKGERYSIKTMTAPGMTTGVFYGIGDKDVLHPVEKKFEYVIIVLIEPNFKLKAIYEISWDVFLEKKRWHSTMRGWNLSLTKDLISKSKQIFPRKQD